MQFHSLASGRCALLENVKAILSQQEGCRGLFNFIVKAGHTLHVWLLFQIVFGFDFLPGLVGLTRGGLSSWVELDLADDFFVPLWFGGAGLRQLPFFAPRDQVFEVRLPAPGFSCLS